MSPSRVPAAPRLDRRRALTATLALGGFAAAPAAAQSRLWADDDPALVQIVADFEPGELEPGAGLIADMPPALFRMLSPSGVRRRVLARLVEERPARAIPLRWPKDAEAVDYAHLGPMTAEDDAPFTLDAAVLAAAADAAGFDLADEDLVVFGLRGAEIASSSQSAVEIRPTRPDLRRLACVIGLWRVPEARIDLFPGSTTPSALHAHAQARLRNAGRVAGLLPTGLFTLTPGPHRPESRRPQPAALQLVEPVSVLRDYGRRAPDAYATDSGAWMLDGGPIEQSIHAASFSAAPFGGVCAFSSSGGPTVAGGHDANGAPTGDWARFLATLDIRAGARDDRRLPFMLITGVEARRAADGRAQRRWRFGASGDAVRALQQALAVPETGRFDVATQIATLRAQLLAGDRDDGVVTPEWAAARLGATP